MKTMLAKNMTVKNIFRLSQILHKRTLQTPGVNYFDFGHAHTHTHIRACVHRLKYTMSPLSGHWLTGRSLSGQKLGPDNKESQESR